MPEPPPASPPTPPIWHQAWFFPAVAAVAFMAAYLLVTFAWAQPWAWWLLGLLAGSAIAAGVAYYYRAENRYFRVGLGLLGAGALLTLPSVGMRVVGSGSEPFEALGWVQFSDVSAAACLAAGCWMMWLDFLSNRSGNANGSAAEARDTTAGTGLAVGAATAGGNMTVIQGLAGEDLKTYTSVFENQLNAKDNRIADLQDQLKQAILGAARVEDRAEAGDQEAIDAVADARERGDTAGLLRVLVERRDESQQEQIELNREIAAIAYLRGDIDIAEEALALILRANPDDISAINESGHIAKLRGDLETAQSSYERVLQLAGTSKGGQAVAYGNLGILYRTRGDLDAARSTWQRAIALFDEIGMPHMVKQVQQWLDELPDE